MSIVAFEATDEVEVRVVVDLGEGVPAGHDEVDLVVLLVGELEVVDKAPLVEAPYLERAFFLDVDGDQEAEIVDGRCA